MKKNSKEPASVVSDLTFHCTLEELKKQFPGKTMLNVHETAKAYGFKNSQTIYNALRKNAVHPFPVRPKKRCGKWFWNIVQIAEDMAS